jgi:hypothetical protein
MRLRAATRAGILAGILLAGWLAPSLAQQVPRPPTTPDAMAIQPDPHDYLHRTDATLYAVGKPMRFAGINVNSLALRHGPDGEVVPTEFETQDLFATMLVFNASYVRTNSMGISAGCADCLFPAPGKPNPATLKRMDHVLKLAHDNGVRLIMVLAGGGADCPATPDGVRDTACIFARWHGVQPAAFFTDAAVRADFAADVTALLNHINTETGIPYRSDTAIAAWENCDGCGAGIDPAVLADWTEFLGRTIKAADAQHLYENGAFAGRLAKIPPARLALPSVDIIGDRIEGDPDAGPTRFEDALDAVTGASRVYIIDSYDWSSATWKTDKDLTDFMNEIYLERRISGALVSNVAGHAEQGGYLPPPPGTLPLYTPGFATGGMDENSVRQRARTARRLTFRMMDLMPVSFPQPNAPKILAAIHGKLRWQGSAGAMDYSIERSSDLTTIGSWKTLCDHCATDVNPVWQDPSVPAGQVWYRMTPFNANGHQGYPSDAVANQ